MRVLGNVLWHIPGLGFIPAILAFVIGFILSVTVVFAPVGLGLMELGKFYFAPFTRKLVSRREIEEESARVWTWLTTIITVIYFPIGVILLILSVLNILITFVILVASIVGIILLIPYLVPLANSLVTILNPVEKKCVSHIVSEELEKMKAKKMLEKTRQ